MFNGTTNLPKKVTIKDIEKLEDAIWEDKTKDADGKTKREQFLELFSTLKPTIDKELDTFLATLPTIRFRALRHCWFILKWKPSFNGKKVLVNPPHNPYKTKW